MTASNKFEVAKFHGIDVAIFDSHWFANKILDAQGERAMCNVIAREAQTILQLPLGCDIANCYAAMTPYRDFMSLYRWEGVYRPLDAVMLADLFRLFIWKLPHLRENFRVSTAHRMLAAEPVRYCIPLRIATNLN